MDVMGLDTPSSVGGSGGGGGGGGGGSGVVDETVADTNTAKADVRELHDIVSGLSTYLSNNSSFASCMSISRQR